MKFKRRSSILLILLVFMHIFPAIAVASAKRLSQYEGVLQIANAITNSPIVSRVVTARQATANDHLQATSIQLYRSYDEEDFASFCVHRAEVKFSDGTVLSGTQTEMNKSQSDCLK